MEMFQSVMIMFEEGGMIFDDESPKNIGFITFKSIMRRGL
jgi:hypothetical protein